jgi:hypothetical protein
MPIAELPDHLYVIEKQKDRVFIYFLTNRTRYFTLVTMVLGLCIAAISGAIHLRWNENVIAGMVGGSISLIWMACYSVADHMTRFTVTIDSDIVSLQRTLEGIPIGFKKNYSKTSITDLGMYPIEIGRDIFSTEICNLCFWIDGRSIELEHRFPIADGARLARDLRELGIDFPRTRDVYDESGLDAAGYCDYFVF